MINDLDISGPYLWKFVDDTTTSEVVLKGGVSKAQEIADQVTKWSSENRVQLNSDKCKELRISFARNTQDFEPIVINEKELEVIESAKLLGVTISNNLSWNARIEEVIKKASKCLYYLVQLRRAKVPPCDLALFYTSCIRSVMDYAAPVFHHSLPKYLMNELVCIEKRAMKIIQPNTDYQAVLVNLNIEPIIQHHSKLCNKLFRAARSDPSHKLNCLLPPKHDSSYNLRKKRIFDIPRMRTDRAKNSFIMAMCMNF